MARRQCGGKPALQGYARTPAGIWTDDVNVAHKAARAIRAGIVWVNTFDAGDISSPFGGFKQSGFGRDRSLHALDKFTDLKAIWIALS